MISKNIKTWFKGEILVYNGVFHCSEILKSLWDTVTSTHSAIVCYAVALKELCHEQHLSPNHRTKDKCVIGGGPTTGTPHDHENVGLETPPPWLEQRSLLHTATPSTVYGTAEDTAPGYLRQCTRMTAAPVPQGLRDLCPCDWWGSHWIGDKCYLWHKPFNIFESLPSKKWKQLLVTMIESARLT